MFSERSTFLLYKKTPTQSERRAQVMTNCMWWAVSLNAEHGGAAYNYSVYGLIRGSERAIYS